MPGDDHGHDCSHLVQYKTSDGDANQTDKGQHQEEHMGIRGWVAARHLAKLLVQRAHVENLWRREMSRDGEERVLVPRKQMAAMYR